MFPQASLFHTVKHAERRHICHFYNDRSDLVEILIPFFIEGLQKGEFCLWGADHPLPPEEAMAELRKRVPNIEEFVERGQLEIFPVGELYKKSDKFDPDTVFQMFASKIKDAFQRGFSGFRCDGNTGSVPRKDWLGFMVYESRINGVENFEITAMCSYPLAKCGEIEIQDVRRTHQGALIKRGDAWEFTPAK